MASHREPICPRAGRTSASRSPYPAPSSGSARRHCSALRAPDASATRSTSGCAGRAAASGPTSARSCWQARRGADPRHADGARVRPARGARRVAERGARVSMGRGRRRAAPRLERSLLRARAGLERPPRPRRAPAGADQPRPRAGPKRLPLPGRAELRLRRLAADDRPLPRAGRRGGRSPAGSRSSGRSPTRTTSPRRGRSGASKERRSRDAAEILSPG